MNVLRYVGVLLLILVAACDSGPTPEPLVIYASKATAAALIPLADEFSSDTGIPVTLKYEDSAVQTNRVIKDEGSPPADVLITSNVADIWRAADEGALRPIRSERLASLNAKFRDPDGYWIAMSYETAVIVYADAVDPKPQEYADLASPTVKGRVCLTSASLPVNRTLMAMLIDELGRRPAELLVRGWIFNRATLPFASDDELLAAIDSGACQYGIVTNTKALGRPHVVHPKSSYFDVHAIGIARHARYPETAQQFVDWMLHHHLLQDAAGLSDKNVGVAGWLAHEADLLAERAGYR